MTSEDGAAIAAEAYGQYDGKPALLLLTSGPGVSNAITGVAAGWTNSTPMFVISGQAKIEDIKKSRGSHIRQVGNQHLDTGKIVSSIVKEFAEPLTTNNFSSLVDALFLKAVSDRMGPVWLSLATDLQRAKINTFKFKKIKKQKEANFVKLKNRYIVDKFIKEINSSKRPILLIGNGLRGSGVHQEIEVLLEVLKIPALTTWTGIDLLPDTNRYFFGRPGTLPSSWGANLVQQKADLVFIFGVRLDGAQVGFQSESFAPNAKIFRIEIDKNEFFRLSNGSNIKGNANSLLNLLKNTIGESSDTLPNFSQWLDEAENYRALPKAGAYAQELNGISTYKVINELSNLNWLDVVLGSSGTCVEMTLQSWKISKGQRFLNSGGLGSMGFAIPAAIGVYQKIRREVLCIESDGSLLMNLQEIYNLKRMNGNVKIVVLNSQGFKSIYLSQTRMGHIVHGCDSDTGVTEVDISAFANSINLPYRKIDSETQLSTGIMWLKELATSAILEIYVSREETVNPRLVSKVNENGQMQTANFTDLWPELRDYS